MMTENLILIKNIELLCGLFSILSNNSTECHESWDEIIISGLNFSKCSQTLKRISEQINSNNLGTVSIDIDDSAIDSENIADTLDEFDEWRIIYSKIEGLNSGKDNETVISFFSEHSKFNDWILALNPFSESNPINMHRHLIVFVNGLKSHFGTRYCHFVPLQSDPDLSVINTYDKKIYPSNVEIKQYVHVLHNCVINIDSYIPTIGSYTSDIEKNFMGKCAEVLSVSLVTSWKSNEVVYIRGIHYFDANLKFTNQIHISKKQIDFLAELVKWSYQDKQETRLKLVRDRISLIIDKSKSFSNELCIYSEDITKQCKEEFDYVISDLRSEFETEKRNFLTDLKNTSMIYYERIRILIGGLFRDIIAISFFVGLNISGKLLNDPKLMSDTYFSYFLFGIGIYLTFSCIIQLIINIFEYCRLTKNTKAWSLQTKSYLKREIVDNYIEDFTGKAKVFFKTAITIWAILYLIIACLFFCHKKFIYKLSDKESEITIEAEAQNDSIIVNHDMIND